MGYEPEGRDSLVSFYLRWSRADENNDMSLQRVFTQG